MTLSLPGIRWLWSRRPRHAQAPAADAPEVADAAPAKAGKRRRGGRGESTTPEAASAGQRAAEVEPAAETRRSTARTVARETAALLLIASGLYAALALASFQADPLRPEVAGANWVGPVGAIFAGSCAKLVGLGAWLLPLELVVLARPLLGDRSIRLNLMRLSGDVLIVVTSAALIHIALPTANAFGGLPVGGSVGELFGEIGRGLFSKIGSFLIGLTIVGLILVQRASFSFIELVQRLRAWIGRVRARAEPAIGTVASAWIRAREIERLRREEQQLCTEPLMADAEQADAIIAAFAEQDGLGVGGRSFGWATRAAHPPTPLREPDATQDGDPLPGALWSPPPAPCAEGAAAESGPPAEVESETPSPVPATPSTPSSLPAGELTPALNAVVAEAAQTPDATDVAGRPQADDANGSPAATAGAATRGRARKKASDGPRIVDTSAAAKTEKAGKRRLAAADVSRFRLPSTDLLEPSHECEVRIDEDALKHTAVLLEKTLADYGVTGKVMDILPGPTVTTFEVAPAPGTKVSKIAGLADDLALGLSRKVRIVAPIPGKNRVGFEVPNGRRVPVNLRELIEDRRFVEMNAPLPCVLGRDIVGTPVHADLASMPHVIVAGATGAGKSVGLAVMLVSLLYRRTPDELRLLLVDPKVVELAPFERIPHLLLPVVTDMKQAANALKWAVDEMERRYQLFANVGTRNIGGYNAWVKRVREGKETLPAPRGVVSAIAPDGTEVEVPAARDGSDAAPPERLPYIVIVVDEFADLMMQQGKDVEVAVARLAQKARAAGMHVILATQRPSVDVITGMIKANFPTRIAFRVAQKVDSRTILDEQGAEHLLGKGDMLVKLNGTNETRRVQCPFCAEDEVQRVTDMLRAQGEPQYDESIVKARDEGDEAPEADDAESDPLYDQAVRIVAETRRCSTSWIQRKLGIGYNRAAKIVETMERNQIVGPPNGSKEREILVSPQ
jgi:S-DNA-T family DNA segregation ATPase FtsK/SpoIIIE